MSARGDAVESGEEGEEGELPWLAARANTRPGRSDWRSSGV